ncbi:hypothetical protein V6N11_049722 [Hibiscus sabdariffa]|uniref:Uncharacterized protein n=1 Tax=Hibiscus sabdariffa TaxID=183260 RepID=A0ABR2T7T3_9ROSI
MVPMRFEFLSRCRKWVSCLNLPFFDDKVVGDEFHSGTGQGIYSRFYVDDMDFVDTEAIVSQTRRWTLFFSYRERYFLSKGSMLQGSRRCLLPIVSGDDRDGRANMVVFVRINFPKLSSKGSDVSMGFTYCSCSCCYRC